MVRGSDFSFCAFCYGGQNTKYLTSRYTHVSLNRNVELISFLWLKVAVTKLTFGKYFFWFKMALLSTWPCYSGIISHFAIFAMVLINGRMPTSQ